MEKAHQRELRAAEHAVERERMAHTERLERWIDDREG